MGQRSGQGRQDAAAAPPQNIEAEESVLGAMLVTESAVAAAISEAGLRAGDFYLEKHSTIFGAIRDLHEASKPIDELAVAEELKQRGLLDEAGGRHYVSELAAKVPAAGNARHYAEIVQGHAIDRAKREVGLELQNGLPPAEAIERLSVLATPTVSEDSGHPFALSIEEFIAAKGDAPTPLIGTEDDTLMPAFGLGLLIAKGGKGKTTLISNTILHLASGESWLGFEVPRPLRILFIENEGPREPFRRKLERHRSHWPHPLKGEIFIYDENWGAARLDEMGFVERLNRFADAHEVDLIVGDPLDSLAINGVGSPEDTRDMVDRFKAAGLFSRTAWLLPHHPRKEKVEDAVDEASGAWGGRPDLMLGLEKLPGERARLSFPKIRWGKRDGYAYLLSYDADTESFEFLCEASEDDRDYAAEIEELFVDGKWRTTREIADAKEGGIGAGRDLVEEAVEADPDRFVSRTGPEAKEVGRHPNATVWGLASWQKPDKPDTFSQGVLSEGVASAPPLKGQTHTSADPTSPESVAFRSKPDAEDDDSQTGCPSHPDAPSPGCRYCRGQQEAPA